MTKTDFHNNFIINRFIREESIPLTDENITKIMEQERKIINEITRTDIEISNETLSKLINRAELELSIAKDKHYYGMQLDGLYIAQAYVNRLLQEP